VYRAWFKSKHGWDPYGDGNPVINLCFYVRAVLFWALPRYLFLGRRARAITFWSLLFVFVNYVLARMTSWHGLGAFWVVVGIVLGLITIVLGFIWLTEKIFKNNQAVDSFTEVLGEYWQATHEKICPIIEIK